jgi:hypothetical protein
MNSAEKLQRALADEWEFVGDQNSLLQLLREEALRLQATLQRIALLADTGSEVHRAEFGAESATGFTANGWRVAEKMREIANDAVGSLPIKSKYKRGDRVRIKFGRDRGHYGTITHVGGDDGTYYGVKLDCHDREMGFSQYELDMAIG